MPSPIPKAARAPFPFETNHKITRRAEGRDSFTYVSEKYELVSEVINSNPDRKYDGYGPKARMLGSAEGFVRTVLERKFGLIPVSIEQILTNGPECDYLRLLYLCMVPDRDEPVRLQVTVNPKDDHGVTVSGLSVLSASDPSINSAEAVYSYIGQFLRAIEQASMEICSRSLLLQREKAEAGTARARTEKR